MDNICDQSKICNDSKCVSIQKIPTYINGFDSILGGGIPRGRTTIVNGGPGCGKSILSMEWLYRNALAGRPGIFVSFEEHPADIRQNALTMGWNLAALEEQGLLFLLDACQKSDVIISGQFNINGLLSIIDGKASQMKAEQIVLDALDILLRLYENQFIEQNDVYSIHQFLTSHSYTSMMTIKTYQSASLASAYSFVDFMADCVIHLDQRVLEQISTRRLRITKYRGSGFGRNEYPFIISEDGCAILPISTQGLHHKALGETFSSGNDRLDNLLGGGYRRGSTILISGLTGAGKTILAGTFIQSICAKNEKVLFIGFEESEDAIVNNLLSPGIDLRPALDHQQLIFLTSLPEAMGAEEHLFRVIRCIKNFSPRHVILDAVSACKRMGGEQSASDYVIRLINSCKENHITTLLLNQSLNSNQIYQISGMEISSLIDTAIVLNFQESKGEINRTLLVLKSRGLSHSNQYREFLITNHGIQLIDVYLGEGGVLTGAARLEKISRDEQEQRLRKFKIENMRRNLVNKEAALFAVRTEQQSSIDFARSQLNTLIFEEDAIQTGRKARGEWRKRDNIESL
ncbi:MAG: circadian clock protein KaiC [Candidatus Magnetomorum sp.]|nr:circadian clock protein KaiC [Candidatus Magnetomorum sp.]